MTSVRPQKPFKKGDHDSGLALIGNVTGDVEARLRALRRTTVVRATRGTVARTLGRVLASTKLLLDSAGIAVLVDSRASGQDCAWSFERQIGTTYGLETARAIRLVAPHDSIGR